MEPFRQFNAGMEQAKAFVRVGPYVGRGPELLTGIEKEKQEERRKQVPVWWLYLVWQTLFFAFCCVLTWRIYEKAGGVFHITFGNWIILLFLWNIFWEAQKKFAKR